jgi:hypothetical protein
MFSWLLFGACVGEVMFRYSRHFNSNLSDLGVGLVIFMLGPIGWTFAALALLVGSIIMNTESLFEAIANKLLQCDASCRARRIIDKFVSPPGTTVSRQPGFKVKKRKPKVRATNKKPNVELIRNIKVEAAPKKKRFFDL